MALPTDVSFMDILFDRDDSLLKLMDDKDTMKTEPEPLNDKMYNWASDDLITDILSNDLDALGNLDPCNDDAWRMDDDLVADVKEEPLISSDNLSDSGYSNGQTSPGGFQNDDLVSCDDEDQMSSTISTTSDSSHHFVPDDNLSFAATSPSEPPRKKVRQVVKVSPMLASNPRSVLLPVNTANGIRTIKIVSPVGGMKALQAANSQVLLKSVRAGAIPVIRSGRLGSAAKRTRTRFVKPIGVPSADSDEDVTIMSEDEEARIYERQQYPRLILSPEEKKLMQKEGISLPTHYPLTKGEERELKRIRRKIRNKISAQDSRKRKKEYLDGLEDRVRKCTEENQSLVKKIKHLQSHNQTLMNQLKKLQAALAGKNTKTAQPATCLLVLILSVALVMAPNLRLSQNPEIENVDQDVVLADKGLSSGRTRSLLSSEAVIEEEVLSLGGEQEIPAELHELLRFHDLDSSESDSSDSRKSSVSWISASHFLADHDYGPPPAKRQHFEGKEYPTDDSWPPAQKLLVPDVDDEWLPKSGGLSDSITTEVKVNASDGSGTRTVVVQVPREKK